MKDFNSWYKELISDPVFMEFVNMRHKNKSVKDAAEIVYGDYVSTGDFPQMGLARRHVHYKLEKMPIKIQPVQTHQEEKKIEPTLPSMDHEAWNKKMEEWKESLAQVEFVRPQRMTRQEIMEEGDWLPKKKELAYDKEYYYEHKKRLVVCIEKTVRERHPEWDEYQIMERVKELSPKP